MEEEEELSELKSGKAISKDDVNISSKEMTHVATNFKMNTMDLTFKDGDENLYDTSHMIDTSPFNPTTKDTSSSWSPRNPPLKGKKIVDNFSNLPYVQDEPIKKATFKC